MAFKRVGIQPNLVEVVVTLEQAVMLDHPRTLLVHVRLEDRGRFAYPPYSDRAAKLIRLLHRP